MTSEWPILKIEDVAERVGMGPFGSSIKVETFVESGVPVISGEHLHDIALTEKKFRFITEQHAKQLAKSNVFRGDVVFTHAGTIGQVSVIPENSKYEKYIISQRQFFMRCNRELVNPLYVVYFFKSPQGRHKLLANASQVGVPSIARPVTYLRSIEIPIPSLAVQNRIVEVIESIRDRITLLRETNATLEAIAQALFKSWFVEFDPVRAMADGRLPEGIDAETAELFPDTFDETELGVVPKGWQIGSLASVSDVGIGKTPPRKEAHWFSESPQDVRWVSIRDMGSSGAYISNTTECLTEEAVDKFNVRRIPDKTVLLSFKMTIGRVSITDGEMTTNEAIAHCKLTQNSPVCSEYIYLHLKQFDYASLSSTSSIADAVNSKTVKAIPILVPSIEVHSAFKKVTDVLFEKIKINQQQNQALVTLRDTLLPRLISGQLRIADAEAELEKAIA